MEGSTSGSLSRSSVERPSIVRRSGPAFASLLTGADPGFCEGGAEFGEREARANNGGLGAAPPAGSRGRTPGGGQGVKPPEV